MSTKEITTSGVAAQPTTIGKSLLDEILDSIGPRDEKAVRQQNTNAIRELVQKLSAAPVHERRVDRKALDGMIEEIDAAVSKQLDKVMHHPEFQKVESAWRGVEYVVRSTRPGQNTVLEVFNASKEELTEDFDNAQGNLQASTLYKTVYGPYDHNGDDPYSAVIANYTFNPGSSDVELLRECASVAAVSHAPFMASAGQQFFKDNDYRGIDRTTDWKAHFEEQRFLKWRSFRESEDARYVGLVLPRFMLRLPYGDELKAKTFNYREEVIDRHDNYLWGNGAFAYAARMIGSFAKTGWFQNTVGPNAGGAVEDLKVHQYEQRGQTVTKVPTERRLSDTQDFALSESGFIPIVYKKNTDMAAFFSANSVQAPKDFGQSSEGKEAEENYRLGTQFPYLMLVSRFAHYLKVLQRENIGRWKSAQQLSSELGRWIGQYANDDALLTDKLRAQRPLSASAVEVEGVPGKPGVYKAKLRIKPYYKFAGANIELSLVSKLDSKAT